MSTPNESQSANQSSTAPALPRQRLRALGIVPGVLPPGPLNAITDVGGVLVGQTTLAATPDIQTGVTAIRPHPGNLYQEKVPAGLAVGNGYGKLMGSTQLRELGEIETPIVLTNTLAVPRAADALLDWTLNQPGNESVRSVNMVVGETNDGYLNAIRRRVITPEHVLTALRGAHAGPVAEGAVGAGTGTVAFGWKGGIGTSSRQLPASLGGYTVGVLVQSNYGGVLQVAGLPIGQLLEQYYLREQVGQAAVADAGSVDTGSADGSIVIVVATDAPLSDRNLHRIASRGLTGLARTGAAMSNGSGDYVIAFSTAAAVRRSPVAAGQLQQAMEVPNEQVSPLFQATIEATEEAIYNSLCMATTTRGYRDRVVPALPLQPLVAAAQGRSSAR